MKMKTHYLNNFKFSKNFYPILNKELINILNNSIFHLLINKYYENYDISKDKKNLNNHMLKYSQQIESIKYFKYDFVSKKVL